MNVFSDMTTVVRGMLEGSPGPHKVLIAGSGSDGKSEWAGSELLPVTLDIDPRNTPDILGSMLNMGEIGPFDAVYCCHALEHLYPHEVNRALMEFRRVLKPGGLVVIVVPDLEDVKPDGKVLKDYPGYDLGVRMCGLHLFYGDAGKIEEFPYMAHHCGFVKETLCEALEQAGLSNCRAERMGGYNLMAIGVNA